MTDDGRKLITAGSDTSAGMLVPSGKDITALVEEITGEVVRSMTQRGMLSDDSRVHDDMEIGKAMEPGNVPVSINYRPAQTPDYRCSTCRFYQEHGDRTGYCEAYDFIAMPDYNCESWQGKDNAIKDWFAVRSGNIPEKYSKIDLSPTQGMIDAAQSALDRNAELRDNGQDSSQGMTPKGSRRASYLANLTTNDTIPPDIWRDINGFVNGRGYDTNRQSPNYDDREAAWVAWHGWGGDAARTRSEVVVRQLDEADAAQKTFSYSQYQAYKNSEQGKQRSGGGNDWQNQKIPKDVKYKECYRNQRAAQRRKVTEKGRVWGAYDSLNLRKKYKQNCLASGKKDADDWHILDDDAILAALEADVRANGGQVYRITLPDGSDLPYCYELGVYAGKDLSEWLDQEWVDISKTNEDGSHPPCGNREGEGAKPKCVPKDKAKEMSKKEKESATNRKRNKPNSYVQTDKKKSANFDRGYVLPQDDTYGFYEDPDYATDIDGSHYAHHHQPTQVGGLGRYRAIRKNYLPGDIVFSESMNSLAVVESSQPTKGGWVYSIKLIDRYDAVHGQAVVTQKDLTPRSTRAIKRVHRTVKGIIDDTDLKAALEDVRDKLTAILSEQDDAEPYYEMADLQDIEGITDEALQSDPYRTAFSMKEYRKYIRAMQDVQHTLSAAKQLLYAADEIANKSDNETAPQIRLNGQIQVHDRVIMALDRAVGALMDQTPMRRYTSRQT